jgi:hypothetical protein
VDAQQPEGAQARSPGVDGVQPPVAFSLSMRTATGTPAATDGEREALSYQVVYRSSDKFLLQTIADLLAADGIAVVKSGQMTGASLGVGDHLVTQSLEVPPDAVERASQLIRDFEASKAFDADEHEEDVSDEVAPRPKKALIAGLIPFVLPLLAAGLLYAEQRLAALLFTVLEWLAFFANTGGYFPGLFVLLKIAEAVLAVEGVRQLNRGSRASAGRQLMWSAAAFALVIPPALVLNRHAAEERRAISRMARTEDDDLVALLRQFWQHHHIAQATDSATSDDEAR